MIDGHQHANSYPVDAIRRLLDRPGADKHSFRNLPRPHETHPTEEVPHRIFQSAIVVPLKKSGEVIGALKLYGDRKHALNPIDFEIANGLANLFSTQLELQDIQIKSQLLDRAEIKRLQAQINPHFLFNSLNTIASFCRTNSNRARQLLLELSNYLRRNIKDKREYITLEDELKQIESYLAIEHARFGKRIRFEMDVTADAKEWLMPPLVIQPLVENAVKHGLSCKEEGGKVWVRALKKTAHCRFKWKTMAWEYRKTPLPVFIRKTARLHPIQAWGSGTSTNVLNIFTAPTHGFKLKVDSKRERQLPYCCLLIKISPAKTIIFQCRTRIITLHTLHLLFLFTDTINI